MEFVVTVAVWVFQCVLLVAYLITRQRPLLWIASLVGAAIAAASLTGLGDTALSLPVAFTGVIAGLLLLLGDRLPGRTYRQWREVSLTPVVEKILRHFLADPGPHSMHAVEEAIAAGPFKAAQALQALGKAGIVRPVPDPSGGEDQWALAAHPSEVRSALDPSTATD
ncbi:hypothetical protein [Gordonia malaquae]|uniref:hypothetical protein n=1 Tax=Gordonia malaquae TaxID=410332 RepID=UPI00301872B7